jgi:solute carrier family 25 oxoglutarate transporter 11
MDRRADKAWFAFVAGGLGDASATLVSHPMDVTKIRLQLTGELSAATRVPSGLSHVVRTAQSIRAQQGLVGGLYAGLSAAVLRQLSFSSMRHGLFSLLNSQYIEHFQRRMSAMEQVLGGAVIGAACAAATTPCDVVLVRMQADGHWPPGQRRGYRHAPDGFSRIVREEGAGTLWRGASATVTRGVLITCSQLPAYHTSKAYLLQSGLFTDNIITHVLCSLVSAATASVISCPADVIKTRLMNMKSDGNRTYSGAWDCARKLAVSEGLGGFYKGLGATFARLGPHTLCMWVMQEQYLAFLRRNYC